MCKRLRRVRRLRSIRFAKFYTAYKLHTVAPPPRESRNALPRNSYRSTCAHTHKLAALCNRKLARNWNQGAKNGANKRIPFGNIARVWETPPLHTAAPSYDLSANAKRCVQRWSTFILSATSAFLFFLFSLSLVPLHERTPRSRNVRCCILIQRSQNARVQVPTKIRSAYFTFTYV